MEWAGYVPLITPVSDKFKDVQRFSLPDGRVEFCVGIIMESLTWRTSREKWSVNRAGYRKTSRAAQVYARISFFLSRLAGNRCGSYLFISPSALAHLCFLLSLSLTLFAYSVSQKHLHFSVVGCVTALDCPVPVLRAINVDLEQHQSKWCKNGWLRCVVTLPV